MWASCLNFSIADIEILMKKTLFNGKLLEGKYVFNYVLTINLEYTRLNRGHFWIFWGQICLAIEVVTEVVKSNLAVTSQDYEK